MMTRSVAALVLVLLLGACTDTRSPEEIVRERAQQRWDALRVNGNPDIHTPNLDGLAQQGMRFTSFYNTSKCFPYRACLLTGIYAQQSGYEVLAGHQPADVLIGLMSQDLCLAQIPVRLEAGAADDEQNRCQRHACCEQVRQIRF